MSAPPLLPLRALIRRDLAAGWRECVRVTGDAIALLFACLAVVVWSGLTVGVFGS